MSGRARPTRAIPFRAWTVCVSVLMACAPADEPRDAAHPAVAQDRATPASSVEDPLIDPAPRPAWLASACLRGDPMHGVGWAFDSVVGDPLPIESIESLAPRDSARLAARLARMVDVLPSDTSLTEFRGLPVVVRAAWRLIPGDGDTVVVALAARRVPIESAPLEEQFLVVAAPGARANVLDPLVAGWSAREVGSEETLPVRELVGASRLEDGVALLLVLDVAEGPRVELVTRHDGRWGATWAGRVASCTGP